MMNWTPGDWMIFLISAPVCAYVGFRLGHAYLRSAMRVAEETIAKDAINNRVRQA